MKATYTTHGVIDLFDPPAVSPEEVNQILGLESDEIIIDCFAGGGGASEGIYWATGRHPDEAINHSAPALAIHELNHPSTRHWHSDVWEVDPNLVAAGRRAGLLWLSPDCTHFSKAKGGKPVSKKIRILAHVAIRYAVTVRPRVIMLENVEEFVTWGPVLRGTERPDPKRKGKSFRAFVRQLRRIGYAVEWRLLRGCDFGAPTTRRRLFLIARCDGAPIRWPQPSHGANSTQPPQRVAAECLNFSLPCPSIFLSPEEAKAWARAHGLKRAPKRPLVKNTLRRVARGVYRFVIDAAEIAAELPQADLLVMDPPFFMPAQHYAARSEWSRAWGDTAILRRWWAGALDALLPRLRGTGSAFVFCDDESYAVFYPECYTRFPGLSSLVWNKGRIGMGAPWRHAHEFILHARRADAKWRGSKGETDVLDVQPVPPAKRHHPVDKPDALLAKLLTVTTDEGDLVLDPFAGGGSTLTAAKMHRRRAIGIELEESYCEVIARRLSQRSLDLGGVA